MDGIDRRVAELFMFDFEQSGIHLEESKVVRTKLVSPGAERISKNIFL